MENESLQDFIQKLPPGKACLILKDGRPEDLARFRSSIREHRLQVLQEREFVQPDGLASLVVSLPPQSLHDLLLELAIKGVGGELIGYEAGEERAGPVGRGDESGRAN